MTRIKNLWDRTLGQLLVLIFVGAIRVYQATLSPRLGAVCRYYPSCSHYGAEAITVHRFTKGTLLTAWRIMRCNPWSAGGIDVVPPRGQWPHKELIEYSTTSQSQEVA